MSTSGIRFTNAELASIYDYLNGAISQYELSEELKRSRTNTYYYVGRAVNYWLETGVMQFTTIKDASDLGGIDIYRGER